MMKHFFKKEIFLRTIESFFWSCSFMHKSFTSFVKA
jgi:hypothetical protein